MSGYCSRIAAVRRQSGGRLLILGHLYQRPEVLRHVDVLGDSLALAREAARARAERIVCCGVRCLADTAALLAHAGQSVFIPEPSASCPMADMADRRGLERAWRLLTEQAPDWMPIIHVNSSVEAKAFCGQHGGCACTSENAARMFERSLAEGRRILFAPDAHLAANSLHDLGLSDRSVACYRAQLPDGGLGTVDLSQVRVVFWDGFCHAHRVFRPEHVVALRARHPGIQVIVHADSADDVVRTADAHGSSAGIVRFVEGAPDGSMIGVGADTTLVQRLAAQQEGRVRIVPLAECSCPDMHLTTEASLCRLLEYWPASDCIRLPDGLVADARACLHRMLVAA